jgi:hypothetical protein
MKVIGKARRRVDGRAKVTGQTRFADDVMLPRTVHCKLLRSTVPHARIVKVDVSRALARPGVHLVLTGADFLISYGILPVSQDEHALAVDRVRFVGDPVAAVIARDELTAFEALDFIDVEYEPLRTYAEPEESLAFPEPRIHDYGDFGNVHKSVSLRFGDVEQAFANADRVFEDTFFYQGNTHLPIEQHAAVAAKDPEGKLVLWSSTQTPHYVHRALAKALALPALFCGWLCWRPGLAGRRLGGIRFRGVRFGRDLARWRLFRALGRTAEFQAIQAKYAESIRSKAESMCDSFGVWTERGLALMFDICVQNGSIGRDTASKIRADFGGIAIRDPASAEIARLRVIANRRAEAAASAFVEDVRRRKLTIANGEGTVHNIPYNLEQQFGIRLVPFAS